MKIAYVYDVIYPYVIGGVEKRIWEVARRLVQRGHEVTIFGIKHWQGDDIIYKEGVRLYGVCPPQELFVNDRRSIKEALYFSWKVSPKLIKERFDIIDCQNLLYFPCFSAKLASVTRKSKLVITWHEVWDNYWYEYLGKKGFFGKVVERIVTRLSNKIITNSEATKRDLQRIGVKKEIRVIYSGVDVEKTNGIVRSSESSDVIFIGRLIKEKNADLVIKAIGHVKKEMPDIQCIIIGEGPEREKLENLISESDIKDNIRLTGFVESDEQIYSWMKASKVLVLPSIREGLGLVTIEAKACGVPTITVNHPQNASCDLIIDGENGFICETSEKDIANKIIMVLDSKNDWKTRCLESAKRYDWNAIVDSLEEVYKAA